MLMHFRNRHVAPAVVAAIVLVSMIPKILMFSHSVMEPFTNSLIALSIETKSLGHVPSYPYTLLGTWQLHANFLSFRIGIVSFLAIMSSVTGLSPYVISSLPLTGILTVVVGYLLGRAFGSRFMGLAFALFFGFSWYLTLTGTNIGYQSYGALLQLYIFFILVRSSVSRENWFSKDVLIVCITFLAIYQTYYSVEFTTLALFIVIAFLSLIHKTFFKFQVKSLRVITFLALWCSIIFLALDTVEYNYLYTQSFSLFGSSISNYLSYVLSIIHGESEAIQEYRPYTSPFSKYMDLASSIVTWGVIGLSLLLYLSTLARSRSKKKLTDRSVMIHVILFSFLFVFFARLSIYGLLGKIAIGWIYISLMPFILAPMWIAPRLRIHLKYVLPTFLIALTIFRFGIIWTDQTLSFIGADYPPQVSPGANWIAMNLNSGSVVSSNQVSAQIFSTVAEHGKANLISINQFGSDVRNLTDDYSRFHMLLRSRGYDYMFLLKLFEREPLFGGFWGPYIPPLGDRVENFSYYPGFSRVYDDGMAIIYGIQSG